MLKTFTGFVRALILWSPLCTGLAAIVVLGAKARVRRQIARKLETEFNEFLDYEPFEALPTPVES